MAQYYQQLTDTDHFYMKRKSDVLHIVSGRHSLMNVLGHNHIEESPSPVIEITKDKFLKAYNQVIEKFMI